MTIHGGPTFAEWQRSIHLRRRPTLLARLTDAMNKTADAMARFAEGSQCHES